MLTQLHSTITSSVRLCPTTKFLFYLYMIPTTELNKVIVLYMSLFNINHTQRERERERERERF